MATKWMTFGEYKKLTKAIEDGTWNQAGAPSSVSTNPPVSVEETPTKASDTSETPGAEPEKGDAA